MGIGGRGLIGFPNLVLGFHLPAITPKFPKNPLKMPFLPTRKFTLTRVPPVVGSLCGSLLGPLSLAARP